MILYRIGYLSPIRHLYHRVTVSLDEITVTVEYPPEEVKHIFTARIEHMPAASVKQVSIHTCTLYEPARA